MFKQPLTKLPAEPRVWRKRTLIRQQIYRLAPLFENRVIEVKEQEPKDFQYVLQAGESCPQDAFGTVRLQPQLKLCYSFLISDRSWRLSCRPSFNGETNARWTVCKVASYP